MAQATAQKTPPKDYTKKINALLAKARHAKTPPAEAEACMAKASELMLRYKIDKQQLREEKGLPPEEIIMEDIDITDLHGSILAFAVYPLIKEMGAQALVLNGTKLTVVATRSLLENIWALFAVLNLNMVSAANKVGDEHEQVLREKHPRWSDERIGDLTDQYVWDYLSGYGSGLADKIKARRKEVTDESERNALVLRTESERIRAWYEKEFPNRGKATGGAALGNMDAAAKGYVDGKNADIGDARVTGDATRAIA